MFAEEEAELLIAEASDDDHLERMIREREQGLPLEQIVGWAEFGGIRISVEPGVFVPRKRSELLLTLALQRLPQGGTVVDLGCGSGAIGAAIAAQRPDAIVWGTDIDEAATACARRNLDPGRVRTGSGFDPLPRVLRGGVHLIIANLPYVPTDAIALMPPEARDFEHRVALDGGNDGLDVQRALLIETPIWLAPDGWVLVETGAAQAQRTEAILRAAGLATETSHDAEIGGTAVAGRRVAQRRKR